MSDWVHITVVCDDAAHSTKTAKVATLRRPTEGRDMPMLPGPPGPHGVWKVIRSNPSSEAQEKAHARNAPTIVNFREGTRDWWSRNRLECPLCGLQLVARKEKLDPVLTSLAAEGIRQVTLGALVAIVTST